MNEPSALEQARDAALENDKTLQAVRFQEGEAERASNRERFIADHVSPPGEIPNLPPLLEARRLKYSIPDMFFRAQPCNNKVNVFQLVSEGDGEKYGGDEGLIHMPDWVKERELQSAPKGILIGGGLKAMDHMYTNGYWIGHVINFVAMNPWRKRVGIIGGQDEYVLTMTCGDITDSDDLAAYIRAGKVTHAKRNYTLDDGAVRTEHYLQDTKTLNQWDPASAEMFDEERDDA